jgi:hypothetical protein
MPRGRPWRNKEFGIPGAREWQQLKTAPFWKLGNSFRRTDPMDQEVLVLRHFEQLGTAETARVLGIQKAAAGKCLRSEGTSPGVAAEAEATKKE